jgi:hypothetical protein
VGAAGGAGGAGRARRRAGGGRRRRAAAPAEGGGLGGVERELADERVERRGLPESSVAAAAASSALAAARWVSALIWSSAPAIWSTPCACCDDAEAISPTTSPTRSARAVISASAARVRALAATPSAVWRALSVMRVPVSRAAAAARWASARTSSATTAKPRPASPARAASTAAFRASRLVWNAISSMVRTTAVVASLDALMRATAPSSSAAQAAPSAAAPRASSARVRAAAAPSALRRVMAASSCTPADISWMCAACVVDSPASVWLPALICVLADDTSPAAARTRRARRRAWRTGSLRARAISACSPACAPTTRAVRSPSAARRSTAPRLGRKRCAASRWARASVVSASRPSSVRLVPATTSRNAPPKRVGVAAHVERAGGGRGGEPPGLVDERLRGAAHALERPRHRGQLVGAGVRRVGVAARHGGGEVAGRDALRGRGERDHRARRPAAEQPAGEWHQHERHDEYPADQPRGCG